MRANVTPAQTPSRPFSPVPAPREHQWRSCSVSLGGERPELLGFVQDHPRERIELADPRLARNHCLRVGVPRVPTLLNPGGAKIDVLRVVLMIELRSK